MSTVDPRIEAFFTEAGRWRDELAMLRSILLDCPVAEAFKWRSPCYTVDGGNVAILWGFKEYCGLGFFKGVLLKDSDRLVAPGENSRSVRMARFTTVAEIAGQRDFLTACIHEAIAVERAGLKVELAGDGLDLPAELVERLDGDPELKTAFEALTPGRQRGYALHFAQPKQSATRASRIEKCAPRILEGKGMHDR